jgi:hypothetical protein
MTFYDKDLDTNRKEEIKRQLAEDQQQEIEKLIDKGEIMDYQQKTNNISNSNGKANKKQIQQKQSLNSNLPVTLEENNKKNEILNEIRKLRQENPELTFEQWSNTLKEKHQNIVNKIEEHFPKISFKVLLELDFVLSLKTILNIEDITLPFLGIVFAAPSSMKTQIIELFEKWIYSYYTDKFTAKSFVSHSATVSKEKLEEVDLLPRIKDKILLTPELSPLFTGKEEDIKEQFGIITKVLDGKGYKSESGVHGQRGYHGTYMFTWIGAAVDIPHYIYKFLSTIGFKIYFLRLPRTEVTTDDLVDQILTEKPFNEKMKEIEKLLFDYLNWFEICPLSIGLQNLSKIEWDKTKNDRKTITIIAELAILLSYLRGDVYVSKSEDHMQPIESNENQQHQPKEFIHGIPKIEDPSRAVQQLYNLARAHALSYGRNYITIEDIGIVLKVVLSTSSIERVLILDLLIANNGTLTTSQITTAMKISNNTAKRTMTEFKGLELVNMDRVGDNSNSEYKITLKPKFKWFLTEEFKTLRDGFKPIDNKEFLTKKKSAVTKIPPVLGDRQDQPQEEEEESSNPEPNIKIEINNDNDSHKGENGDSKNTNVSNNIQSDSAGGTTLSSSATAFTALMSHSQQQSMESNIQAGLFINPLISESDLLTGNYDPEIINNIDRVHPVSDRWFCHNCTLRDDKWGMMKHPCKSILNKEGSNGEVEK